MQALVKNNTVIQYPYSVTQLKKDNPQTSFPANPSDALLASYNVFPVKPTERPAFDPAKQRVVEGTPEKVSGQWTQVWNVVALTAEETSQNLQDLQRSIVSLTQRRLDDFARTRGYDSILSACSYATSLTVKFQQEGRYCVAARDETWVKLTRILDEVLTGQRQMPAGYTDIEPELPPLVWPE